MAADASSALDRRDQLGSEGAVRVYAYQCKAAKGDRPQADQFLGPSISFVRSGVFGFRSEHEHGGGDCCVIFAFDDAVLEDMAGAHPRRAASGYFARSVLPPVPRIDALRHRAEQRLHAGATSLGLEELGLAMAAAALEQAGVTRPPKPPPDSRSARDRVFGALALLERSSAQQVQLTDIADAVGLSPYHFLRLFKREVGITPYQFLIQSRIRRAIELLRDTQRPVTDIAFDIGFGDLSNFINAFRREVGCSPMRFRKLGA
jgi:AraC-like DNA-binding protein